MKIRQLARILPVMIIALVLMTGAAHANFCEIRGLVWHDLDCDGIQDPGEPGVPGVKVWIYKCGPDGLPGTPDDVLVDGPRTDIDGRYSLDWLRTGQYWYAYFTQLPPGFIGFSPQDQGADDTVDSDPDPATGMTDCFLCECSVECTSEPQGSPLVLDAGLCMENGELFPCPKTIGYWKTHPHYWPVDSLTLGIETYDMNELLQILWAPVRRDASLILAKQLIAAKLNVANGTDPGPISATITAADDLLTAQGGRLPLGIHPKTDTGEDMVHLGSTLDNYNNSDLTPDCLDDEDKGEGGC